LTVGDISVLDGLQTLSSFTANVFTTNSSSSQGSSNVSNVLLSPGDGLSFVIGNGVPRTITGSLDISAFTIPLLVIPAAPGFGNSTTSPSSGFFNSGSGGGSGFFNSGGGDSGLGNVGSDSSGYNNDGDSLSGVANFDTAGSGSQGSGIYNTV
jgi:hypothetical protein